MTRYQKLSSVDDHDYPPLELESSSLNLNAKHQLSTWSSSRLVQYTALLVSLVVGLAIGVSLGSSSSKPFVTSVFRETTLSPSKSANWSSEPQSTPPSNATIVILVSPSSNMHHNLLPTLANIEEKFNRRLGYPIQLLTNDELPNDAIMRRTSWITGGKAKWSLIKEKDGWGPPASISPQDLITSMREIGFSKGYRNMCRFYSMFHWKHPALRNFEWIWRLDDTSHFQCALMEDPIELMQNTSAVYGYSQIQHESLFVIPTLWETTKNFLKESNAKEKGWLRDDEGENWLDLISEDQGETYNLKIFYNNFEIVHRSFLESDAYRAYVDYLDKAGGFYRERWGDAPVRTIATTLFLPRRAFYDFSSITGYQHEHPSFVCPDYAWCDCDPAKSGKNGGGNW